MPSCQQLAIESDVRMLVAGHLASGRIPAVIVSTALAGYGSGEPCIVCEGHITSGETEYEVETVFSPGVMRFHVRCHELWQQECRAREARVSRSSGPAV